MSKILIDTGPSERGVHRLETANHCMQLFAYSRKLGLFSAAMPLVRGTLGHIGLAHYYARIAATQRGLDPEAYYEPLEAIDVKIDQLVSTQTPGFKNAQLIREKIRAAVAAYMVNFATETFTVWGVEHVVEMKFNGRRLTQRLDLVTQDRHGRFWLYDHKFVGAISKRSVSRYALSGQFLEMYHQGLNLFGDKFGGVRVNLIGVEKLDFHRDTPPLAPHALSMFPRFVEQAEQRIEACEQLDPWDYPKAFSELACMTPYGPCPGTDLCRWGPSHPVGNGDGDLAEFFI